ncbi:MAG: methyl-accepting chemotaxis protein [Oscillospiraceae bacterium]|nr:methyl-accepting chemotaxis protein [Oscillospiraceae bacterium]
MTIKKKVLLSLCLMAAIGMILGIIGLVSTSLFSQKSNELHYILQERTIADDSKEEYYNEMIEAKITEIEKLESRMKTTIITFLIAALVLCALLVPIITKSIVKPLIPLAEFMRRAGITGDLVLKPENLEVLSRFARTKDEIGQTIENSIIFVKRITKVSQALEVVANGDLSAQLSILSEHDLMGHSLNRMLGNLNKMFSDIDTSATQVATGSSQISEGAQSLAQGSTEQAASVQQLSASISEIADKTKANAQMAGRAAQLAENILEDAEKGSHQMDQMISATKEITQASHDIGKIIKVIDDIAFQTNILALNAAVEAARAGQHGKGFAVVAEEVRNLAAKSAEAAKDTGELISNSIEKAQLGAEIAGDTATSFVGIVSEISESNQIVHEIAKSSEEQSAGITQINIGIDQVAQVIQQNSATAEESAAASEQLSSQSDMMRGLIEQVKLKENLTRMSSRLPEPEIFTENSFTLPDVPRDLHS